MSLLEKLDLLLVGLSRTLWRLVLGALGVALVLGVLLFGLVLSLIAVIWSLLRGKRPSPVRFQWQRAGAGMPPWAQRGARQPAASNADVVDVVDVVDVEVREVPPSPDEAQRLGQGGGRRPPDA